MTEIKKHPRPQKFFFLRCDAYYQCGEGGNKFDDQFCPSGLYYNAEKAFCDWPENVQCKNDVYKMSIKLLMHPFFLIFNKQHAIIFMKNLLINLF